MSLTMPDRVPDADKLIITVIEPDAIAPVDRLGQWLFAAGATLETWHLWKGEPLPSPDQLGDGLVILGGAMSAHADATHTWLPDLRDLIRHAVATYLPTLAVCLGAQVAAEALGGHTWVAAETLPWQAPAHTEAEAGVEPVGSATDGERTSVPGLPGEHGVAWLHLTEAGATDPSLPTVWDQAVRAAVRAGIPTQDGTVLPVLVSHDDAVVARPSGSTVLTTTPTCPIHTWRAGRLLAVQHHPEATPARMAQWAEQDALDTGASPAAATAAAAQARLAAEAIDGVVQTFGQALAGELVRAARGRAAGY